ESLGIERSWQAIADADLTIVVIDLSQGITADDRELMSRAPKMLVAANKCDLAHESTEGIAVSAKIGEGIAQPRDAILEAIAPRGAFEQESSFITSVRHERLLIESAEYLEKARAAVEASIPHEMLLLDLYAALRPIDAITGATTADDILNRIFSTFCIGK